MGIYDREYYQDEDGPRGFRVGSQSRMLVTNIVIMNVAIFVVDILAGGAMSRYGGLSLGFYQRPYLAYQLLTYGFLHGGPLHLGFNMFILWMFGRFIEQRLGRSEFLWFYLVSIVFSGLTWVLAKNLWLLSSEPGRLALEALSELPAFPAEVPVPLLRAIGGLNVIGASGGVVAVFILFVLFYPRQKLYLWGLIEMPAWVLGALLIGLNLIQGLGGAAGTTAWQAHLGGAAFAALYLAFGWNFTRMLPSSGSFRGRMPRKGPRLKIHNPDDDLAALAAEADRILDKLHREGEHSLTNRERRKLEEYSRRMRERRG